MGRDIIILLSFLIIGYNSHAKIYKGIDVSHHQKQIDWQKVADDKVDFVYIKATEGAREQFKNFMSALDGL